MGVIERYFWMSGFVGIAAASYYIGANNGGSFKLGLAALAFGLPTGDIARYTWGSPADHWVNEYGDNSGPSAFMWLCGLAASYLFAVVMLISWSLS
jgi:hypothetical protein